MEQTALLRAENLSFAYDKENIFSQVSFSLQKGEIFTILGSNGAGKSTLLNCVSNLLTPAAGQVFLDGQPIASIPLRTVAQKIGLCAQMGLPSFSYTVRDYVVMGRAPTWASSMSLARRNMKRWTPSWKKCRFPT